MYARVNTLEKQKNAGSYTCTMALECLIFGQEMAAFVPQLIFDRSDEEIFIPGFVPKMSSPFISPEQSEGEVSDTA